MLRWRIAIAFSPQGLVQALDDQVRKPHENPPIGIILCKSANRTFVEYAVRDYKNPMGVATCSTANEMEEQLRKALPDTKGLKRQLSNTGNMEEIKSELAEKSCGLFCITLIPYEL